MNLDIVWDFSQVLLVALGQDDSAHARPVCG